MMNQTPVYKSTFTTLGHPHDRRYHSAQRFIGAISTEQITSVMIRGTQVVARYRRPGRNRSYRFEYNACGIASASKIVLKVLADASARGIAVRTCKFEAREG